MKKGLLKQSIFILIALLSFTVLFNSCDSWMSDDDEFYSEIEAEVKEANAQRINVFVRYSATKMGKTDPDGYTTFKVGIPSEVSATTETDYGFWRWAAFSTSFIEAGDKQYTSMVYEDDDNYKENYGVHELSSDIVKFSNPYSTKTSVTVYEDRSDIFLVPVVAKRPTIALTMPSSGSSGVVRNMTLRINFSKAMDAKSFMDENGVFDKFTVTQGSQSITSDGDIEITSEEITDRFAEPTFSKNEKMVTLKFKDEYVSEGFAAQSYVTVVLSKDITDKFGYKMADDIRLQFQVGSNFDTLAPRINLLTAGVGENYNTFEGMYKDANTAELSTQIKLKGASKANSNIDNPLYTEELLAQRIKDKINIRIFAEDIAGSGSGQDQRGVESDVSMIGIRATNLISKDGTAAPADSVLPIKSQAYVAQTNNSDIKGSYRDITGETKGYLFSYDLSTLPDGLIKIDVWCYDSIGNNGLFDGGSYSSEYGNGYASIFVVKDTSAPDAVANAFRVRTSSLAAPYGWYNSQTLSSMKLYESSKGAITDTGHPKIVTKPENLKWFFNITSDTEWASKVQNTDSRWKFVSEGYDISNAAIPTQDGPVAISMILMDDMDNISNATSLSSVMYDNTPSVLENSSWVKADGSIALNASAEVVLPTQILKIPYTESLSGIRRIELKVNGVAEPMSDAHFYKALPPVAENEIKVDLNDSATTANIRVFESPLNTGDLYVTDLKIGDTDGIYTVAVNMYDSSLNKSNTVTTSISKDTTKPVIVGNKVEVKDMVTSTSYDGTTRNYLPYGVYDESRNANKATVTFKVNETGSGIEFIEFVQGSDVNLTASSELFVNGTKLVKNTESADSYDYVITGNTIRLHDSYVPKLFGENVVVAVTNVHFTKNNNANVAKITIRDFVNTDSNINSEAASSPVVYSDKISSAVASVVISDQVTKNDNGFANDNCYSATSYTDSDKVRVTVTIGSENADNGAGIKKLALVNGIFTASSKLKISTVDGVEVPCTFQNNTVTFNTPFAAGETLVFTDVQFTDLTNGAKSITVIPTDFIGWTGTSATSNSTVYDNVAPSISADNTKWTVTSSESYTEGITYQQYLDTQILHIPFTEATTGLRKLRIKVYEYTLQGGVVTRGATTTTTPFDKAVITIGGKVLTKGTDYTVSETDTNVIIFNDSTSYKTGEIVIEKLKVNNTGTVHQGGYIFDISLMDKAENTNATSNASITLVRDTIEPVIQSIEFPSVESVPQIIQQTTDGSAYTYWFNSNVFSAYQGTVNKLTANVKVKEETSGVKRIVLGGNIRVTDRTVIKVGRTLVKGTDYTVSEDKTAINLISFTEPVIRDTAAVVVTLTNLELINTTNGSPVAVSFKAIDWARSDINDTPAAPNGTVNLNGLHDSTTTKIYFSNDIPSVSTVTLKDRGTDNNTDGNKVATTGFTNEALINLYGTVAKGASSGISGLKLRSGAVFTEDTQLYINGSATPLTKNTAYTINTTDIQFTGNKVYAADTTFKITNVKLSSQANAQQTVTVCALTPTNFNSTTVYSAGAGSGSIILDTTKPTITGSGLFTTNYASYTDSTVENVYPRAGSTAKVVDGKNYFYTKAKNADSVYGAVLTIPAKDNIQLKGLGKGTYYYYKNTNTTVDDVLATGETVTADTLGNKTNAETSLSQWFGAGTYTVVVVDEAGNCSDAYKMNVIRDIAVVDQITAGSTPTDAGGTDMETAFEYADPVDGCEVVGWKNGSKQYNVINYHSGDTTPGSRVQIDLNFNDKTNYTYSEASSTATQSGLAYYQIGTATPDTAITTADNSIAYGKWIPYTPGAAKITVYPSTAADGVNYLHLKDNVGNIKSFEIRSKANKDAGVSEYWDRDGDNIDGFFTINMESNSTTGISSTATKTGFTTFTGDGTDVNSKPGYVFINNSKNYYDYNNASFSAKFSMYHAKNYGDSATYLSGANKGNKVGYSFRVSVIATASDTAGPTKAEADAHYAANPTLWTTGSALANNYHASTIVPLTGLKYPSNVDATNKYIWLMVESYTGNYGCYLIQNQRTVKEWVMDNTAPTIYVKGTTDSPATYSTEAQLNTLVTHPGKRVWLEATGKARVSHADDSCVTMSTGTNKYTTDMGKNTYRSTYTSSGSWGGLSYSGKRPYFNLDIEDDEKIYAYCFSYGNTVPDFNKYSTDTIYNTTASSKKWYITSSLLDGKVSVMIDTPHLETETGKEIYLHVRDTVGHVTTSKMGDVTWTRGDTYPRHVKTDGEYLEEGSYYLKQGNNKTANSDYNAGRYHTLNIAGAGPYFTAGNPLYKQSIKVYVPSDWFSGYSTYTDATTNTPYSADSTKGIYGFSMTKGDVSTCKFDASNKPYLEIPYTTYSKWDKDSVFDKPYYIYDKVGNFYTIDSTEIKIDTQAPAMDLFIRPGDEPGTVMNGTSDTYVSGKAAKTGNNEIVKNVLNINDYASPDDIPASKLYKAFVQNPYFTYLIADKSTNHDAYNIRIYKWVSNAWDKIEDYKDSADTRWWRASFGDTPNADYGYCTSTWTIAAEASGAYYKIALSDSAGNTTYGYTFVQKDTSAPQITNVNVVAKKGSINKSGTGTSAIWYYHFAEAVCDISDAEAGIKTHSIFRGETSESVTDYNESAATLQRADKNYVVDYGRLTGITETGMNFPLGAKAPTARDKNTYWALRATDNLGFTSSSDILLKFNGEEVTKWYNDIYPPETPVVNTISCKLNNGVSSKQFARNSDLVEITSKEIATISFKPKGTDYRIKDEEGVNNTTGKVIGFIDLPHGGTPVTDPGYYNNGQNVKESFEYTCGTSGNPDILLDGTSTFVRDYYAVDGAGNISTTPLTLTYKYGKSFLPVVESYTIKAYEGEWQDSKEVDFYIKDNVNYYRYAKLDMTISVPSTTYKPTSVSLYQGTTKLRNVTYSLGDYKEHKNGRYYYSMSLGTSILSNLTGEDSFYIVLHTDNGSTDPIEIKKGDLGKFYSDTVKPVTSGIEVAVADEFKNSVCINEVTGGFKIMYYGKNVTSPQFTLSKHATDSGSGLYSYSVESEDDTTKKPLTSNLSTTVIINDVQDDKAYIVNAFDNVGNYQRVFSFYKAYSDETAPTISSITNTISGNGAVLKGDTVYFNTATDITFTVNASDPQDNSHNGSGIRGYTVNDGAEQTENTFTITPEDGKSYSFCVVDKVGNVSTPEVINFVKDDSVAAPAIGSLTFKDSSSADVTSTNANGSGSSYYYHSGIVKTVFVVNTAITKASGTVKIGYSTDSAAQPASWETSGSDLSITLDNAVSTYYIWSKDAVGNTNKTSLTLTADADDPTISIKTSDAFEYVTSASDTTLLSKAANDPLTSGDVYYSKKASINVSIAVADGVSGVAGVSDGGPLTITSGIANSTLHKGSATTYTVTDKVGHTATFTLTLNQDDAGPAVTISSISTTGTIKTISNVNFFKDATVEVSATDDLKITGYQITASATAPSTWEASGSLALPDTASGSTYYLWAKDILGNVSTAVELKDATYTDNVWTCDKDAPSGTVTASIDESSTTKEGEGIYYTSTGAGTGTVYFNTKGSSDGFTLKFEGASDAISGFAGYTAGDTGTPAATVTFTGVTNGTVYDIYAWDNVGNKAKLFALTAATVDSPAPVTTYDDTQYPDTKQPAGYTTPKGFGVNTNFKITSGTVYEAWDNGNNEKHKTNLYTSGTTLQLPIVAALNSDAIAYALTIDDGTPASYESATITNIGDVKTISVTLPSITGFHQTIYIWLKDKVGNIGVYNIGYPGTDADTQQNNPGKRWWAQLNESPSFTYELKNNNITISGLSPQSAISKIKVEGTAPQYQQGSVSKVEVNYGNSRTYTAFQNYAQLGNAINLDKNNLLIGTSGTITITGSNIASVSQVTITFVGIGEVSSSTPTPASSKSRLSTAWDTIKTVFSSSSKSDYAEPGSYAPVSESIRDTSVTEQVTSVIEKKSAPVSKVKKAKKVPRQNKSLSGTGAESVRTVNSVVSEVVPDGAKVLEAVPINTVSSINNVLSEDTFELEESELFETAKVSSESNRRTIVIVILVVLAMAGVTLVITNILRRK